MGKMKNFMMDIEEFVDGYFYDAPAPFDFTAEEILGDVGMMFRSDEAVKYAQRYLNEVTAYKAQLGDT